MIDVDLLYNLTNDLIQKDSQGGYTSNSEYNRLLALAQETLFEFFYDNRDEADARRALNEFHKVRMVYGSGGYYNKPADYKEKEGARLVISESSSIPVHFPARDEMDMTLSSAVRGPSIDRKVVIGEVLPTQFKIWPASSYFLELRYYTTFPVADRVMTIDVPTQSEVYDADASTQLSWAPFTLRHFTDLLLLFKGVILRDSPLIQWVGMKKDILEKAKQLQ